MTVKPYLVLAIAASVSIMVLTGCEPRVHIEPPEKPIEINLNLKIDHEVRVKLDKEIDELISENPDLF